MTHTSWIDTVCDNSAPLFFILGPCSMESKQHVLMMAEKLTELSRKHNFNLIFKSSFDKANRSSLSGYRSLGIDKGLELLAKVKEQFDVPVITDIHTIDHMERVASVVDVLQIPAFLSRQTDLLLAAGNTGKPIFVKKAQFVAAHNMDCVVEKLVSTGNEKIWLGERGYSFGYNNLIVDYRNFPLMKNLHKPVIFDATHSVQQPGALDGSSGGNREFVAALAVSAVAQGIAGLFMEVHDEPERALCDGPNSVRLSHLDDFLAHLIDLDAWVKQHPLPEVF